MTVSSRSARAAGGSSEVEAEVLGRQRSGGAMLASRLPVGVLCENATPLASRIVATIAARISVVRLIMTLLVLVDVNHPGPGFESPGAWFSRIACAHAQQVSPSFRCPSVAEPTPQFAPDAQGSPFAPLVRIHQMCFVAHHFETSTAIKVGSNEF